MVLAPLISRVTAIATLELELDELLEVELLELLELAQLLALLELELLESLLEVLKPLELELELTLEQPTCGL